MGVTICSKCVMDTTDANIKFDASGVCDHCITFKSDILPNWDNGKNENAELIKLADKIKKNRNRKNEFDCIIGMSGGIDSSYLLYIAKVILDLNPLVFHVDAGWNTKVAVNNIEKLIDKLNLDLFTEVIDWNEMRDLQLSFFKSGVPHIDAPQDHAYFATMYKFAEKYNVKYILTGGNLSTECIRNPIEWMYYQSDSVQLVDIHKRFGQTKLVNFPITNILKHKVYLPYLKNIKVVRPLDLTKYIKDDAIDLLVNDFGWEAYPQKHFESRFTKFYEGYWLPSRFGFDTRKVQFSSLILTGQMSRDEAMNKLSKTSYDKETIDHDKEYIANKLNIKVSELEIYHQMEKRSYKDYKSQNWLYNIGGKVMKMLKLELGGKR